MNRLFIVNVNIRIIKIGIIVFHNLLIVADDSKINIILLIIKINIIIDKGSIKSILLSE